MSKKKRKREHVRVINWSKQPIWINILIGEGLLAYCLTGKIYHLPRNMMIPTVVLGFWLLSAIVLGQYADARDTADVWWEQTTWRDHQKYLD